MLQRTDEWYAQRLGKVTASRVADLMARTKTGWGASRANYMAELITERLTGCWAESYTNGAMQWGVDTEAQARAAYEFVRDCTVVEAGFVPHPDVGMAGASPDGYVGDDGLVEIKCPATATHLETLLSERCPEKYFKQIQFQMACTGRAWCDWVSFDPRLPGSMQMFIDRVTRDDKAIAAIESAVVEFLNELDGKIAELTAKYQPQSTQNILAAG